jgi:hypothetical protein
LVGSGEHNEEHNEDSNQQYDRQHSLDHRCVYCQLELVVYRLIRGTLNIRTNVALLFERGLSAHCDPLVVVGADDIAVASAHTAVKWHSKSSHSARSYVYNPCIVCKEIREPIAETFEAVLIDTTLVGHARMARLVYALLVVCVATAMVHGREILQPVGDNPMVVGDNPMVGGDGCGGIIVISQPPEFVKCTPPAAEQEVRCQSLLSEEQ